MYFQNLFTPCDVRPVEHNAPVKTARAEQGRVQNIGAVRGCSDDHVRIGVETIHLDQNLVQRLLPLVVRTTQARTTVTTHGVYLVQKDDTRAVSLRLLKQVTHPGGPHAYKHLYEL